MVTLNETPRTSSNCIRNACSNGLDVSPTLSMFDSSEAASIKFVKLASLIFALETIANGLLVSIATGVKLDHSGADLFSRNLATKDCVIPKSWHPSGAPVIFSSITVACVLFRTLISDPVDCRFIARPNALKIKSVAVPTAYGTIIVTLRHFGAALGSLIGSKPKSNIAEIKKLIFINAKCILCFVIFQLNH